MNNFESTSIAQNFSHYMYNNKNYDIAKEAVPKVVTVLFYGVSEALADLKSKDRPTAFVFKENNGEFIAGAVVEFIPNEDPSNPGNWNYYWTWDQSDIDQDMRVYTMNDAVVVRYFKSVAQSRYSMGFTDFDAINEITKGILKIISKWLDDNASEEEEKGVNFEGVFQARVAVENGEKVKSLEVDGEIKKIIKDDAAIEV